MKFYKVFICFIIFFTCAVQGPPGGGPADTTPPEITSVFPADNDISINRETEIHISFSKYMSQVPVERSIFISPEIKYKFRWKGKTVYIKPDEPLSDNVTYVITVGSDARDLKNNSMQHSYSWAFSTGEIIDAGKISGSIFTVKGDNASLLFAYKISQEDTVNPAEHRPDYMTQSDVNGNYELNYISEGTYRLFAVKDKNNNMAYDIGIDDIGIPPHDLEISMAHNTVTGFLLYPLPEDTTAPYVLYTKSPDKNTVEITFSEELSVENLSALPGFIVSEEEKTEIVNTYFDGMNRAKLLLKTAEQKSGAEYTFDVSGLKDNAGNNIKQPSLSFTGTADDDTSNPFILSTVPGDSSKTVPAQIKIELLFSEPVDTALFNNTIVFNDGNDSAESVTATWENPVKCIINPAGKLTPGSEYILTIKGEYVRDHAGNDMKEAFTLFFKTGDLLSFGSLSGKIDAGTFGSSTPIVIILYDKETGKEVSRQTCNSGSTYRFSSLLPGTYRLFAFPDKNGDSKYFSGKSFPFLPSYRFTFFPEPVIIRSGWDNENVNIGFNNN